MHIHNKDESSLVKQHLHSSNYLDTLGLIREGLIGAGLGLMTGLCTAAITFVTDPFGAPVPLIGYVGIIFLITCLGAWLGGLAGVASENKKIANFHQEIVSGKYLVLIYAKDSQINDIQIMMGNKHQEVVLAAVDANFFNPFADLKLISPL